MKSDRRAPVAIVGGGASGTILAAQLAHRDIGSIVIEGTERAGRGVAYSTDEPSHLLNVPADQMSAWAGDPDHFARAFEAEGGDRNGFAPRRTFGRYLAAMLEKAIATGKVEIARTTAVAASNDNVGWRVRLADGSSINADALVLATGNQQPGELKVFANAGERFIANPWGRASEDAIRDLASRNQPALLIGTSLTMVDLVLSLEASGHRGNIVAVSRRGLMPRAHADYDAAPVEPHEIPHGDLRALLRWIRRRSAEVSWRAAIDSLRPYSHALWQHLGAGRQRRFMRHARPWWDVHRHRIAPEVASTLDRLIGDGRLDVVAGRVISASRAVDGLDVEIVGRRSNSPQTRRFAYAFNCTGPLHSIERTKDPLLRSLLETGAVRPDQLGIGLEVNERSHVMGGERLWALGPLTKGRFWEIIAVPDIRGQAATVADDIARELKA